MELENHFEITRRAPAEFYLPTDAVSASHLLRRFYSSIHRVFFIAMKRNRRGGRNSSISSFLHEIQNSDNITIIEISSQLDDPFS